MHNRIDISPTGLLKIELSILIGYSSENLTKLRKENPSILEVEESRSAILSEMLPLANSISSPGLLVQAIGDLILLGLPMTSLCVCLAILSNVNSLSSMTDEICTTLFGFILDCAFLAPGSTTFHAVVTRVFLAHPDLSCKFKIYCESRQEDEKVMVACDILGIADLASD